MSVRRRTRYAIETAVIRLCQAIILFTVGLTLGILVVYLLGV